MKCVLLCHFVLLQQRFLCLNYIRTCATTVLCCFLQKWLIQAGNYVMFLSRYAENKLQTTESFQQLSECVLSPSFFLMPQTVLLLLSLLTVQCGGCDFDWEGVKNIKTTIDSNPTGFVS